MSLSNSNRRLSVATLAGVEQQGHGSLDGGSLMLGLQNTLSCGPPNCLRNPSLILHMAFVHQGQSPGVGSALSGQEGSSGACSSSFSGLLLLIVCGDEGLRFLEAGHRLFASEYEGTQDGDSRVCSSLGSARRLDGVCRLEGCLLAGSDSSRQPQVPQVRGSRPGVPVQGTVLWSLHGSSGLYQGHGSSFDLFTLCRYPHPPLPGRLAVPGSLMLSGSDSVGCGSPIMSFSRGCRQLGEVSSGACAADDISWRSSGVVVFQGFACPEKLRSFSQ